MVLQTWLIHVRRGPGETGHLVVWPFCIATGRRRGRLVEWHGVCRVCKQEGGNVSPGLGVRQHMSQTAVLASAPLLGWAPIRDLKNGNFCLNAN